MEKSLWQATGRPTQYPPLTEELHTQVLVVGAGLTGLLTAYQLQCRGMDTVVIDAEEAANGTSSRSTGKLTAQHGACYHKLLERGMEQTARDFYKLNRRGMELIRTLGEQLGIDCGLEVKTAWLYTAKAQGVPVLTAEHEAYGRLGIPGQLTQRLPVPISARAGLSMEGQYSFHPQRFLQGLAEAYCQRGGRIYAHTPAQDVREFPDCCRVSTKQGVEITCQKLVIASHFPFYDGWGLYFVRLVANRSYLVAGKTELQGDGMYISIDDEPMEALRSVHFTQVDGQRYLLVGGEGHRTGVANPHAFEKLETFGKGVFGVEEMQYHWSAQDYTPTDDLPYIGRITKEDSRIFVATGFNKWGNSTSAAAALVLEELVADGGSPYEEMFCPTRAQTVLSADFLKNSGAMMGKMLARADAEEELPQQMGEGRIVVLGGQKRGCYLHQDGELYIVDAVCPHMGCELQFNAIEHTWDCPCHGSRFHYDGSLLEGPAADGLQRYELPKQ